MSEKQETKQLSLTAEDLQNIIKTAIEAGKAPNAVEQRKIDQQERQIKADQEARLKLSEGVKQIAADKRATQLVCSHEHNTAPYDTHCVYVMEKDTPGYFLCQKNQCIIRPEPQPAKYKGTAIFDTNLFNKLFQKQRSSGEIFG